MVRVAIDEPEAKYWWAYDSETFRIGAENGSAPPWVCGTAAWRDENGAIKEAIWGSSDDEAQAFHDTLKEILEDDNVLIIGQNIAFDLGVAMVKWPDLTPLIFAKYAKLLVYDTRLAEKVLNLSTHGRLDYLYAPDGKATKIHYSLADLELNYCDRNRFALKDGEDLWRTNFDVLHGLPAREYPKDAMEYALGDAVGALEVCELQHERARKTHASLHGARVRATMDFAYFLVTMRGIEVDQAYVDFMKERVNEIASVEHLPLLVKKELLIPAQEPQPHKRNKDHVPGCKRKGCDCPPAMTLPKKEKFAQKLFQAHCLALMMRKGMNVRLTDTGQKLFEYKRFLRPEALAEMTEEELAVVVKYVSTSSEVMPALALIDPVCEEFQRRQSVAKVRQEIGLIDGHTQVHPQFDTFKETTRTSSFKSSLIPSRNIQQVANFLGEKKGEDGKVVIEGIEPRRAHVPRPGMWFLAADYDALELCMVAQTTWDLFRNDVRCVHREKRNKGMDLHAYLGSQLAVRKSDEFRQVLKMAGADQHEDSIYQVFLAMKGAESEELRELFKLWRTMAKPTGLGFPGGLGPATMVGYAAKSFGVVMTVDEAAEFREFWRDTYPEMREYVRWINTQTDEFNPVVGYADDGFDEETEIQGYWYETPYGIVRRGARFCAVSNGKAMQSPAAEGFNTAAFNIQRACYDWTMQSDLYGAGMVVPLHDEAILEVPGNYGFARPAAKALKALLEQSMSIVAPDVLITAEPLLMSVWSKKAEAEYDDQGHLKLWVPASNPHLERTA